MTKERIIELLRQIPFIEPWVLESEKTKSQEGMEIWLLYCLYYSLKQRHKELTEEEREQFLIEFFTKVDIKISDKAKS